MELSAESANSWLTISFLGTSLSVTALPVLACVLSEKKLLQSKVGVLTLSAGPQFTDFRYGLQRQLRKYFCG